VRQAGSLVIFCPLSGVLPHSSGWRTDDRQTPASLPLGPSGNYRVTLRRGGEAGWLTGPILSTEWVFASLEWVR